MVTTATVGARRLRLAATALALATLAWLGRTEPALASHQQYNGCYGFEDGGACDARQQRERTSGCVPWAPLAGGCDRRPGVVDPWYGRIFDFVQNDLIGASSGDGRAAELQTVGQAFQKMADESKVDLLVHRLPEGAGGVYVPAQHVIVLDERLVTYTPHVVTTILLHELTHAYQEIKKSPVNCYDREADAYGWQARLWRAWFGAEGKQPPGDEIERSFNAVLALDNQGELRPYLERSPHYQRQCAKRQ